MDTPIKARKKPVVVRAIQWTGGNEEAVRKLADACFMSMDLPNRVSPEMTAEVFDRLHYRWIPLRTGDWVIEGIRGEFYPCERLVFTETYDWPIAEEAGSDG